ncbi:MAG: hypothetical protein SGJ21_09980, partial [Alphaproteobacteria bacterium]|nr:hypothetical protein [Alphaproteobacteria bacterium]
APAQAQDGPTMWCYAEAGDGAEAAVRVYSAFFSAGAHEAIVKARAFKSAVAAEQISASSVTATCLPAPNYETAVAARNAEMKKAPGKVTAWEG